jgi:hypothetical protein
MYVYIHMFIFINIFIYLYASTYTGALLEIFFRATATFLSTKGEEGLNEVKDWYIYMYVYICM